jgi:hypothetical protein
MSFQQCCTPTSPACAWTAACCRFESRPRQAVTNSCVLEHSSNLIRLAPLRWLPIQVIDFEDEEVLAEAAKYLQDSTGTGTVYQGPPNSMHAR